jgi:uncharacterized membrane protein YphA (DoxX/SURF4 family)
LFYRVDYILALLTTGLLLGLLFGGRAARIDAARLARVYYFTIIVLLSIAATTLLGRMLLPTHPSFAWIGKTGSDLGSVVFGSLFGLSLRRSNRLELLRQPAVFTALCLAGGFGFIINGFLSSVAVKSMTDFFTQSGYTEGFQQFIMTIEVFGGIGLLVPWAAPIAAFGLSIDMFGSLATHIHNGDPLNDSTGAISQLIRLTTIALIWAIRPTAPAPLGPVRKRILAVGIAAVISAIIAFGGARILRHHAPAQTPSSTHS